MNSNQAITAYEFSLKLQHIIKFEMWNNFPRLDKNETKLRETINKQIVFRKDRLKDFIEAIKKKYTNFFQLAYFEDEEINSFYDNLIIFDFYKEKFLLSIDFNDILYNFYEDKKIREKISKSEFKNLLKINLKSLSANEIIEKNKTWLNLNLDGELFEELHINDNQMLNELVKFNPTFDLNSVSLQINIMYPDIEKNIASFLFYKQNIKNLILKISTTQEIILDKNSRMKLSELSNDNLDHSINKIFEVILDKLIQGKELNTLIIICEKHNFILNESNIVKLSTLFDTNDSLSIFIMKNIDFSKENSKQREIFFNQIYHSKVLRYVHMEAIYFDDSMFEEFEKKFENISVRIYLRYDGYHLFNNFSFNEETPTTTEIE